MSTQICRSSATIYAFPPGGRAAGRLRADGPRSMAEPPQRPVEVAIGGAWYHEAAIRESEPGRKR